MASYLLFLPNCKGADPAQLDRCGLADLRSDRSPEFAEYLGGQLGSGNLAYWPHGGMSPNLDCSLYDWTKLKNFSIGVLKGQQVIPDDIQREPVRSGYWVLMADGQRWQIPAASKLPHKHGLDESGEHTREVANQFKDYWDKSQQFAVQFFQALDAVDILRQSNPRMPIDDPQETFSLADTWNFCCRALSINYRLTPEITSHLGLFDDDAMCNTVKAAIDLTHILECKADVKKKDELTIPLSYAG